RGYVWIGSENGLFLYKDAKTPIKRFYSQKNSSSIPGNNINFILEDKNGTIWIALWHDGLCRYNSKNATFEKMPVIGQENNPFTIFQDNDGVYWIGTWSDGLFRFELKTSGSKPDYQQFIISGNKSRVEKNCIYSITQDSFSGDLWILSHSGVDIIADRKNVSFQALNVLAVFENASNYLNHLYRDRQGNIWLATLNDGVYLANLHKPLVNSNPLNELKRNNGYVDVNAIIEIDNKIWLGLRNFGVYVVDKQKNNSLQGLMPAGHKIMRSSIRCFSQDKSPDYIWVGGNDFFAKYNQRTKQVEDMSDLLIQLIGKGHSDIAAILTDSKNNKWIATRKGIVRISARNEMQLINTVYNNVQSITEDKNGNIWAGSASKGLFRISQTRDGKYHFEEYNIKNKKIHSDEINTIYVNHDAEIWVGTNNGGLNKYSAADDKFISQNDNYKIFDQDIKSIIEDNYGMLWISVNNKIIKIDTRHKTSLEFSSNDIAEPNYFKPGATFKDSEGKLYFGGGNGYNYLYPNVKRYVTKPNNISISDIQVNNKSIFQKDLKVDYNPKDEILKLNYHQRNISFEFSALNFNSPANINYAYKLSDVDKDWVYVDGKRRYVNYNNLTKGNYVFEVKSTDENGVWLTKTYKLQLILESAPYETWWAYLIYILTLAGILLMVYRTVTNRISLRRDLIISKIRQEQTEELTQIKLSYFTNISHELLTPLTIISCLIDDFHLNFPNKFKQYSIMKSNITRLMRLLQQILDFRKVESGNMKLNVSRGDLVAFIQQNCVNNFDPLAKKKNISFSITGLKELPAFFDADKVDKILFNILSNAFKYTHEQGTIELNIQSVIKNDVQYVKMFVNDTGNGIETERLTFIFDRFYGNDTRYDSNGIGLSLTKELVEIHKGTISVESQVNVGTCFVVELPIDGSYYTVHETAEKVEKSKIDAEILIALNEETDPKVAIPEKSIITKSSKTVLIVEDNPDLLMVLSSSLSRFYIVIQASNGEEALTKLNEIEIDLVVSDVMMPVMDGLTLCRKIKDNFDISHTPVLLLTAKNQIEDRIDCYNAGADAYISKPFEMDVLIARLSSLLFNKQKRNQEFQSSLTINPKNYENNSIDGQFLKDAIKIVEDNLANFDFTHEQLIDEMNTSKSTLYRKIKSLTGLSPSDFVRNIRLKHACLMLKGDTGNISDIAYAVGFNDPKYFSTCFKSEFGLTPREFIKKKKPESAEETRDDENINND
ncbi:MAG: response regulator, partial [Bacteroidota bacterium]